MTVGVRRGLLGRKDRIESATSEVAGRFVLDQPVCVHLLLVGHMDAPYLNKRIAVSPVADRIHKTGHRVDAPSLSAACDVFVLPSIRREGLARALIEAMAYGVPGIDTGISLN